VIHGFSREIRSVSPGTTGTASRQKALSVGGASGSDWAAASMSASVSASTRFQSILVFPVAWSCFSSSREYVTICSLYHVSVIVYPTRQTQSSRSTHNPPTTKRHCPLWLPVLSATPTGGLRSPRQEPPRNLLLPFHVKFVTVVFLPGELKD